MADICLTALAAEADIRLAVAAEVDTCQMALAAAIALDTAVAVPTDNPYWAAAIVQMVVRVVVTATVAFAMEADRVDIVALAVDIVT